MAKLMIHHSGPFTEDPHSTWNSTWRQQTTCREAACDTARCAAWDAQLLVISEDPNSLPADCIPRKQPTPGLSGGCHTLEQPVWRSPVFHLRIKIFFASEVNLVWYYWLEGHGAGGPLLETDIDKTPLWKSQNLETRLKHTPGPQRHRRNRRKVRRVDSHWAHPCSLRPAWYWYRETLPGHTVSPVGKESQQGHLASAASWDTSWDALLGLTIWESLRETF